MDDPKYLPFDKQKEIYQFYKVSRMILEQVAELFEVTHEQAVEAIRYREYSIEKRQLDTARQKELRRKRYEEKRIHLEEWKKQIRLERLDRREDISAEDKAEEVLAKEERRERKKRTREEWAEQEARDEIDRLKMLAKEVILLEAEEDKQTP